MLKITSVIIHYNLNKYHKNIGVIKSVEIEELVKETNKFDYELFENLIVKVYTQKTLVTLILTLNSACLFAFKYTKKEIDER